MFAAISNALLVSIFWDSIRLEIEVTTDYFKDQAPELYHYYLATMESIADEFEDCALPNEKLPFAAYTFNLGSHSVCLPHEDMANLACGWCAVMPFGGSTID